MSDQIGKLRDLTGPDAEDATRAVAVTDRLFPLLLDVAEAAHELHGFGNRPDVRWATDPTFPWPSVVKIEAALGTLREAIDREAEA